mgnify:CR=1 FL=1
MSILLLAVTAVKEYGEMRMKEIQNNPYVPVVMTVTTPTAMIVGAFFTMTMRIMMMTMIIPIVRTVMKADTE